MKVATVLKLLQNRYRKEPVNYWLDLLMRNSLSLRPLFRILKWLQPIFPGSRIVNRPLEDLRKTERPRHSWVPQRLLLVISGCPIRAGIQDSWG
jgi:hypothetical protein